MKKTFMGLKLRRLRAERGLSQTALAHTLGISPSYLNQIEQNQRPLTVSVLLKISQTLGVDVQQFSEDDEARLVVVYLTHEFFCTVEIVNSNNRQI